MDKDRDKIKPRYLIYDIMQFEVNICSYYNTIIRCFIYHRFIVTIIIRMKFIKKVGLSYPPHLAEVQ